MLGRKEIVLFFYLYFVAEILAIFLDSAIIPTYSGAYPIFAAIYVGLSTAIYWCLLLNGFVGFQFAEDGTPKSLWVSRIALIHVCLTFPFSLFEFPLSLSSLSGSSSRSPLSRGWEALVPPSRLLCGSCNYYSLLFA